MARRIFKYELDPQAKQSLLIPEGAQILSVQFQRGILCMWAIVDTDNSPKLRTVSLYTTGEAAPPTTSRYLATFMTSGGYEVFHVFEDA